MLRILLSILFLIAGLVAFRYWSEQYCPSAKPGVAAPAETNTDPARSPRGAAGPENSFRGDKRSVVVSEPANEVRVPELDEVYFGGEARQPETLGSEAQRVAGSSALDEALARNLNALKILEAQ